MQRKHDIQRKDFYQSRSSGNKKVSESSRPEERWVIARNSLLTAFGLASTYYVLYFMYPVPVPPLSTPADRMVFTLRLQSLSCITLICGILYVALTRLHTTAIDPIEGHGEHHVALGVRYLTNTMEQLFVSMVGQLVLSTYLTEAQMKVIPILVLFFVFGRVAFFFGYRRSYLQRSVGFVSTFIPSIIMWLVIIGHILSDLMP